MADVPSAPEVLAAIRQPGESWEKLAARLDVSVATINRWKKRSPRDWPTILGVLEAAGVLTQTGEPRDPASELEHSIRRVLVGVLHEVQFPRLNDLASRLEAIETRQDEGADELARSFRSIGDGLEALNVRLQRLETERSSGAGES